MACTKFKNYMHVSSFVYDFHLRYFQSFLENLREQFPTLDYVNIVQGASADSHSGGALHG